MTLLTSALRRGRAAMRARMRGQCTIRRVQAVTTDPTGGLVTTWVDPDPYQGPCYVRYPGVAHEATPESGGAVLTVSRIIVRIPHGPVIRPGDVVTITSDPDTPQIAGTRLRVASIDDQSQATAQRLLCEDVQDGLP